jgi:hypothetical protein
MGRLGTTASLVKGQNSVEGPDFFVAHVWNGATPPDIAQGGSRVAQGGISSSLSARAAATGSG